MARLLALVEFAKLFKMKKRITIHGVEPFEVIDLKFNVLNRDMTISPKFVKVTLVGTNVDFIKEIPTKAWFNSIIGNKLVVHIEDSEKVQHLKNNFGEFLEVENLHLDYILNKLYQILIRLDVTIMNFEYEVF